ncbi:MAG: 30S ribosomal protein S20 [Candidatus Omnitrophica bacterium]|nr:30S ribosomal protein S20 [Candidatus Omnitrophota bacterium]
MPQRKTSVKDLKKNRIRQMRNLDIKSDLRKTLKAFTAAATSNPAEAQKMLAVVYKKIDKAAKRNIFPKNTASRRKAKFAKLLVVKKA